MKKHARGPASDQDAIPSESGLTEGVEAHAVDGVRCTSPGPWRTLDVLMDALEETLT